MVKTIKTEPLTKGSTNIVEQKPEVVKHPWSQDQINLIKTTVAVGATNDELKLFLVIANKAGLDPFTKQIHFVKRAGKGTIQTGIDGYRAIAERTKTLAGIDDAVYDTETESHPNKASVTVYRIIGSLRVPFTASARWTEYCPNKGQDFMWNKMPYLMLAKCAESLALRKAFPNDLSGIYTDDEMQQASTPDSGEYTDLPPSKPATVISGDDFRKQADGEIGQLCVIHNRKIMDGKYGNWCGAKDDTGRYCKGVVKTDELPVIDINQDLNADASLAASVPF